MNTEMPTQWAIQLPEWVSVTVAQHGPVFSGDTAKMRLAIALANGNIDSEAGGPFGAAVFDDANDALIAVGVNLVFASGASLAHAEMVALTLAQARLGTPDLSGYRLTLVTSAEPCAMCLGALPWSGISRVICGARDEDVRAVGFDEGSKPQAWINALARRNISVVQDVLRSEATQVLQRYAEQEGRIY